MTIAISKDDLLKIDPWQYDNQQDLLNAILDQCTELNNYIGKIRLVNQPDKEIWSEINHAVTYTGKVNQPPKLQQFDGKDWVDVEIVEETK